MISGAFQGGPKGLWRCHEASAAFKGSLKFSQVRKIQRRFRRSQRIPRSLRDASKGLRGFQESSKGFRCVSGGTSRARPPVTLLKRP